MTIQRHILLSVLAFSLSGNSYAATEILHWETYQVEGSGISLDAPYPFKTSKSDRKTKEGVQIKTVHGFCWRPYDASISGYFKDTVRTILQIKKKPVFLSFNAYVTYELMGKKGKDYNAEELINQKITYFNKYYGKTENKNAYVHQQPFVRPGYSGTLLTENCDVYNAKQFAYTQRNSFIWIAKKKKLWRVSIFYTSNADTADTQTTEAVVRRMIDSIKIEPPKP